MTFDQAAQVEAWHLTEGWRAVARLWVDTFGEDELLDAFQPGWTGNQLAGMELCERAADLLGRPLA